MTQRATALLLTSIFFSLSPGTLWAQSAVIAGIVHGTDGAPVAEATVTAQTAPSNRASRTTQTVTDDSGRFSLIGLRPGRWIFVVEKLGFEPVQNMTTVRRTGRINMSFVLEFDPFNPPAPATGALAGIRAVEIQLSLQAAHALFDEGDFDGAIGAYQAILKRIPTLTSLNLQIGDAYREKKDIQRALAAYQAVPANTPASSEAQAAIESLKGLRGVSSR